MSEIGTPAELRLGQKPGPLSLRGLGWTGQRPVPTQLLLGFGFLLVAVGGFDGRTDAGQHLLGWLSKGTVGLQFQILVESFGGALGRSEEHTSELQSRGHLVCRLLLEKKKI